MDARLKCMNHLIQESNSIVIVSGLGVAYDAGLNGVRAEHIAYDIEQKYGYSSDEIMSSLFLNNRVTLFYDYYKQIVLNTELQPTEIHKAAAKLQKAGKLDMIVTREVYPLFQMAGCKDVIEMHGSVEENYCPNCGKVYGSEFIRKAKSVPSCEVCNVPLRPGFTLIGEMVDNGKMTKASDAVEKADILLIVGASVNSPLCRHLIKYYKGKKMMLVNTHETVGDERADYRVYGNLRDLFAKITDIQEAKEDE